MSAERLIPFDSLVACPGCDRLHRRLSLETGERAECLRCGDTLQTACRNTLDRSLAAALSGLVLLLLAVTLPFLSLSRAGIGSSISVLDATSALWASDFRWLGLLTLVLVVLLPMVRFALLTAVLWPLRFGPGVDQEIGQEADQKANQGARRLFRWALALESWAMADIFMVGVAVSLVKIGTMARLQVGLAFWALLAAIGVSLYLARVLCRDTVWQRLTTSEVSS